MYEARLFYPAGLYRGGSGNPEKVRTYYVAHQSANVTMSLVQALPIPPPLGLSPHSGRRLEARGDPDLHSAGADHGDDPGHQCDGDSQGSLQRCGVTV